MKKSKFFAAALAATMFATAACGLVACDKDPGEIGVPGTTKPPVSQGTEYTVTFSGTNIAKTTTGGKLSGTMPTATAPSGKEFKGWAKSATATTPDITASNYTSYTFSGTNTAVTLYPVFTATGDVSSEYTITLDATTNGGTCGTASVTTTNKVLPGLPAATKGTDTFNGWYTAATGGTKVNSGETVDGTYTTLYAQFTPQQQGGDEEPESDGELLVGGQRKLYLTDNTANIQAPLEGNTATYEYMATGVSLNAGDVVTFKIKGEVLVDHATAAEGPRVWDTDTRHGATFNQAAGSFTVKSSSTGMFDIYVRYYDTGTDAAHPCWSIEFTDGGVDSLVPGGVYLAGSGFANAAFNLVMENYIDPDEGLIVTLKQGDTFKGITCGDDGQTAIWNFGDPTKYREVGGSYLNFTTIDDGYGNGGVKSGTHTYKVTLEDGIIVFTLIS